MATSIRNRSNGAASPGHPPCEAVVEAFPGSVAGDREGDTLDPWIGGLYEAAVLPEGWPAFLEGLARAIRVDAMRLIAVAADGGDPREACIDPEDIVATVAGQRSQDARASEPEQMELLQRLAPHLRRALRMRGQVERLAAEREAAAQLLERVPVGTILVDARRRIIRTNHRADAILGANDGLHHCRDELETACPRETGALRRAIDDAADTSRDEGSNDGSRLRVSRPSGELPYLLEVSPVDRGASPWGSSRTLAAILVTDADAGAQPDVDALRAFYDLTPAEAELAAMLARGLCLDEAASLRGVTRNTARGQLKRVFAKTATNRQAELVRIVLQGPAGFARR